MTQDDRTIDLVAAAIYNTHWHDESTPTWENSSDNVKDFVRAQARSAIEAYERSILDN